MVSRFFQNTYSHAVAVTPSDTNQIKDGNGVVVPAKAIYVGGAGAVAIKLDKGQTVTFAGAAVGTILPLETSQVLATGTTATNLVALY